MSISKLRIVRALWTNPYAPSDWSETYLYPEIPNKPLYPDEVVYVWGDENIKVLEERGYNYVKMDDNEYPYFNREFTQHGKKLIALDKSLKETGEALLLDWDCVQLKDLDIEIIRQKETQVPLYCYTEKQITRIKDEFKLDIPLEEELRKYHWKLEDLLVSPNFGLAYSRDKKFAEKLIVEAIKNKINYCIEEHAMFNYANCTLDEYIDKYHPTICYGRAFPKSIKEIGSGKLNEYVNNKIGINEYFRHL